MFDDLYYTVQMYPNPKWEPVYILGTWQDPDDLRLQDAYTLIIFKWLYQDAESYNPEF